MQIIEVNELLYTRSIKDRTAKAQTACRPLLVKHGNDLQDSIK